MNSYNVSRLNNLLKNNLGDPFGPGYLLLVLAPLRAIRFYPCRSSGYRFNGSIYWVNIPTCPVL